MYLFQKEDEKVCVDKCIPNYNFTYISVNGTNKCLGECNKPGRLEAQYRLFNTYTCVDECSGSYPFTMEGQKICVQSCSSTNGYPYRLPNTTNCLDQCPSGMSLIMNGDECTDVCPDGYPYEYKGTCIYNCEVKSGLYKVDEIDSKV